MAEISQPAHWKEVESLHRRLDELSGQYEKGLTQQLFKVNSSAVFTEEVMKTRIPSKFSHPRFKMYDGSSDPVEHVQHFKHVMILYGENDGLLCKVFPSSLEGPTLPWFQHLEPWSISSFAQLCRIFISQFIYSKKMYKEPDALLRMEKKDRKIIQEFTQQFRCELLQIEGYREDFAIMAYRRVLSRHSALACSLVKKKPNSLVDLYTEVDKSRAEEKGALPEGDDRKRRSEIIREYPRVRRREEKDTRNMNPTRGHDWPRFTIPPGMLIPYLRDKLYFRWPTPLMGNPKERDKNKFCAYHKDHSHRTGEYRDYWDLLNELLHKGLIEEFVEKNDNRRSGKEEKKHQSVAIEIELAGVIDVINGVAGELPSKTCDRAEKQTKRHQVFVLEEESEKRRKFESEIMFSEEDLCNIKRPHADALVISVRIKNFEVKQVLVDLGSSMNVLFISPYYLL